jgi:NADPH-dependent 2,4-dienoyl-CoA reductase/sulfur reductase-like enzyme/rhodanese-related sulfurtransferase
VSENARTIVVVGASAAGLRCACRLSRLQPDWSVRVVEAGDVFSYAACGLPYVLSGDISERDELRRTSYGLTRDADFFAGHKGVEVLTAHRAVSFDPAARVLVAEEPGGRVELPWDELVLATGATPARLPGQPEDPRVVPFHVWDDVKPLKQALARGELDRVAILGAGLVGCELAEAFRALWGAEVVLIEATAAPLPGMLDPDVGTCVARHLEANGVELRLGEAATGIETDEDGVSVVLGNRTERAQAAVVAIGVEPATALAREAGVELGRTGAIAVDERMATSVPHVWAAGDCAEVRHAVTGEPAFMPLGSLANRQGRTLANVLAGIPDALPPVAGAMAVKVFDWNVAAVGCTARRALKEGFRPRCSWVSLHDRADYWPESKDIRIKLVYDPSTRRVLGVQSAGDGETVKRVDVATALILNGATLEDFAHLEHAYAPPYAPALDPLAVAAFAAQNQEAGVEAVSPADLPQGNVILDVRLPEEAKVQPAPEGGQQIPLGELRDRLGEVDKRTDLVVCERGTRSTEAVRLLRRKGILARYIGGGLLWNKT